MIPYIGCERARDLLDAFLDEELAVDDQVAVESHLRWCRTCSLRVEDMRLIGASLRLGSPVQRASGDEADTLTTLAGDTLERIRAERDASFPVRFRELFVDMRLLWPALGATLAVLICVGVAGAVLQAASAEQPDSLAAILETLANPPGSELNPVRPDGGNTIPRVLDDATLFEGIPPEDGVFTIHTVVGRDGKIAKYDVLRLDHSGHDTATAAYDEHVEAAIDAAVRQFRFAPAQAPTGRAVAVNMVWMIVVTTAEKEKTADPRAVDATLAAPVRPVRPEPADDVVPADRRSAMLRSSATA